MEQAVGARDNWAAQAGAKAVAKNAAKSSAKKPAKKKVKKNWPPFFFLANLIFFGHVAR